MRNKFLESRMDEDRKRYNCVSTLKKTKKNCHRQLNEKNVTGYKKLENSYDWQLDSNNFK